MTPAQQKRHDSIQARIDRHFAAMEQAQQKGQTEKAELSHGRWLKALEALEDFFWKLPA